MTAATAIDLAAVKQLVVNARVAELVGVDYWLRDALEDLGSHLEVTVEDVEAALAAYWHAELTEE